MSTGWFALGGVLLGGFLNGFVTWLLRRSDARTNARVAALLVTEELMISMPAMLELEDDQTWAPIKNARHFAGREAWEEYRSTLAHSLPVDGYISLSTAYAGLANARGGAEERANDAPLTDDEGGSLASTLLAMNRGMSYLTLLVYTPSRLRPFRRRRFMKEQQAHADKTLSQDVPFQEFMAKYGNRTPRGG